MRSKLCPALGNTWAHLVNHRIMLIDDGLVADGKNAKRKQIRMLIAKSNMLPISACNGYTITQAGLEPEL